MFLMQVFNPSFLQPSYEPIHWTPNLANQGLLSSENIKFRQRGSELITYLLWDFRLPDK